MPRKLQFCRVKTGVFPFLFRSVVKGGRLEDARLTAYGREYLALNPLLRNPIDWKWIITTAIALAAALAAFLACSRIG